MRIAVVNPFHRRMGGTETYLGETLPDLHAVGHDLGFLFETETNGDRSVIQLPDETPSWSVESLGREKALAALAAWKPDLIYAHGRLRAAVERSIQRLAPSLYFAHDYRGTCISGHKTWQFPIIRPCDRTFGPACLFHYFPHRCGGRNPLAMLELYGIERARLARLRKYNILLTHSRHMRNEYLKHGFDPGRVRSFSYFPDDHGAESEPLANVIASPSRSDSPVRLLFVGRMEKLKGGHFLLQCLPAVARGLKRSVALRFAGDGPQLAEWRRVAEAVEQRHPEVSVTFEGWRQRHEVEAFMRMSDLLVVPSLWPEPFGRIGIEAAALQLPVAAFAVGGITDWLVDGVNGCLAPGDPPTANGLGDALVRACDPALLPRLRVGCDVTARKFEPKHHIRSLVGLLEEVAAMSPEE